MKKSCREAVLPAPNSASGPVHASSGVFLLLFSSKSAEHVVVVDRENGVVFDIAEQNPLVLTFDSLRLCAGLRPDADFHKVSKSLASVKQLVLEPLR